jgi:hypothetical protein
MSPFIIIHEKTRIESNDEKIIYVPLPETNGTDSYPVIGYRAYKLQCERATYEIHCPEVHVENRNALIVPSFMVPGRPYPIYVYIYAVGFYIANPDMGQREAARQTKEYFGLETFSHTTLGRAMKKIELLIHDEANEPDEAVIEIETQQPDSKRFPTVKEMRKRKEEVLSYIKKATGEEGLSLPEPKPPQPRPPYKGPFIDACHRISAYTYKKYRRLLL